MKREVTQPILRPAVTLWEGEPCEMRFRWINPGWFRMGSRGYEGFINKSNEEPRHWVHITRPFLLGETPVTEGQYRELTKEMGLALPEKRGGRGPSYDKHPAVNVRSEDIETLVETINIETNVASALAGSGVPTEYRFRLPTEAEWEYACRGGTETEYHTGDGESAMEAAGWFLNNSGGETRPVGGKVANGFGLHDMHGNVWEWCRDVYDGASYREQGAEAVDPRGNIGDHQDGNEGSQRVLRGGSCFSSAQCCRASIRDRLLPGNRIRDYGFRLCLSSGPVSGGGAEVMGAEPASGAGESGAIDRATRAGGAGGADGGAWAGARLPNGE